MAISFQLYDLINIINDFYFVQWQLNKELFLWDFSFQKIT